MTTLYRLYDADRRLLYVGVADDWLTRLRQHEKAQSWWVEVAAVERVEYPDREGALVAEGDAIYRLKPAYNQQQSGGNLQMLSCRLPPDIIDMMKRVAKMKGCSQTAIVMQAMEWYVGHVETEAADRRKNGINPL